MNHRVIFYINSMLTFIDVVADSEEQASNQISDMYKRYGELFELVEVVKLC